MNYYLIYIALFFSLLFPVGGNAKSVYLILLHGKNGIDKIQMQDMAKCQEEGEAFKTAKTKEVKKSFICIEA